MPSQAETNAPGCRIAGLYTVDLTAVDSNEYSPQETHRNAELHDTTTYSPVENKCEPEVNLSVYHYCGR